MTTMIRTPCPNCEVTVDVAVDDVHLHVPEDPSSDDGRYAFRCPTCRVFVVKPADATVAGLLTLGGVDLAIGGTPPWAPAPSARPATGDLHPDDVLALRAAMEEPGWIDRLADECCGGR